MIQRLKEAVCLTRVLDNIPHMISLSSSLSLNIEGVFENFKR